MAQRTRGGTNYIRRGVRPNRGLGWADNQLRETGLGRPVAAVPFKSVSSNRGTLTRGTRRPPDGQQVQWSRGRGLHMSGVPCQDGSMRMTMTLTAAAPTIPPTTPTLSPRSTMARMHYAINRRDSQQFNKKEMYVPGLNFTFIDKNMFNTCQCIGHCLTNRCPCTASGLECDMMECSCKTTCPNTAIQRGQKKHVLIGKSGIPNAGRGLFAGENINKGDLVGAYLGEVISNKEGTRRAVKYDRKKISYLMENCDCHDSDSSRCGTYMSFLNHAHGRRTNVKFLRKICRRIGGHQVGVFATKKISEGTELLIDYGSEFVGQGLFTP